MIGRTIADYRILSRLGAGGMGEVFLADDVRLGRQVAFKVLPPEVAGHPERLRRFEQEARAAASLNHPNIVTVYGTGEADGVHFLTMELVEGRTLADSIVPGGLPIDEALAVAVPLADALAAVHERRLTHRDLKPRNVMITDDGRVKVLDFGLAKLREEVAEEETRLAADHGRAAAGHAGLHVARTGAGASRRCAVRHLRVRRRALRDGHGPAAVRRRVAGRHAVGDPARRAAAGYGGEPGRACESRARHPAVSREGPATPLSVGGGPAQ